MGKATGALVLVFSVGGAAMTLLSGMFGGYAELAALGVIGGGLFASSQFVASKPARSAEQPTLLTRSSTVEA
jgi:hypothetical protein